MSCNHCAGQIDHEPNPDVLNIEQIAIQKICEGDVVFIPSGTWHNVVNIGRNTLKMSSVYALPNHRKGTVHCTKAERQFAMLR